MKKGIIIFVCLFSFMIKLNAECSYSDLVKLNTLSSYVDYTYEFDENSQYFFIKFINVVDSFYLKYLDEELKPNNGNITINNLYEGSVINVSIHSSSNSNCPENLLRTIKINLPYLNKYYNSVFCDGNSDLPICKSKFVNYNMTFETFKGILKKQKEQQENKNVDVKEDEEEVIKEDSLIDIILKIFKNYWIKGALILGSSLITFIVGNLILKKVKYKL